MTQIESLLDQLRRTHDAHAWYGPSVREVLADVTHEEANRRPYWPEAKTIWEQVGHLRTWKIVTLRRLRGETIPNVSEEENWPSGGEPSETRWRATLQSLERVHGELIEFMNTLTVEDLAKSMMSEAMGPTTAPYSAEVVLAGLGQHDAYDAAQIALTKRAIRTEMNS